MGKFSKSGGREMPELNTASMPDLVFAILFARAIEKALFFCQILEIAGNVHQPWPGHGHQIRYRNPDAAER